MKENLIHPMSQLSTSDVLDVHTTSGVTVSAQSGQNWMDGGAGLWCTNIGTSRKDMAIEAFKAIQQNSYSTTFGAITNQAAESLANRLLSLLRDEGGFSHLSRVFFGVSGSEANDTSLKLVQFYNKALGTPNKRKVISLEGGFHGLTYTITNVTGIPAYHAHPIENEIRFSCPHYYKYGLKGETPEQFTERLIIEAEKTIIQANPDLIGAFISEPIMGVGGVIIPPPNYFQKLQTLLNQYNIVFIADEVITGFGRTGKWFGSTHVGIKPDIITFAKGLTSGYFPLSATVISERIATALTSFNEPFMHGFTMSGHPVGARLALKNLHIIEDERLISQVANIGRYLHEILEEKLSSNPFIGDIRSIGQMHGIEYVKDKFNRVPFDVHEHPERLVSNFAKDLGLFCRPLPYHHVNSLSPAFTLTEDEADIIVERLVKAVDMATPSIATMAASKEI